MIDQDREETYYEFVATYTENHGNSTPMLARMMYQGIKNLGELSIGQHEFTHDFTLHWHRFGKKTIVFNIINFIIGLTVVDFFSSRSDDATSFAFFGMIVAVVGFYFFREHIRQDVCRDKLIKNMVKNGELVYFSNEQKQQTTKEQDDYDDFSQSQNTNQQSEYGFNRNKWSKKQQGRGQGTQQPYGLDLSRFKDKKMQEKYRKRQNIALDPNASPNERQSALKWMIAADNGEIEGIKALPET